MQNDTSKNSDVNDLENDTEDLRTIIIDDSSKDSTSSMINKQRLAQDDSFTVMNQTTEGKRNDELANESYVGAADESRQAAPREVVTMGDGAIEDREDLGIVMGTEADVTDEDLMVLGDKDQDMDGGEDEMIDKVGLDDTDFDGEPLNEAATDMASTGEDLDMPDENINNPGRGAKEQGDEENDYYSLGGDKD